MRSPQFDDELEGQDCYQLVVNIISKFIQIPTANISSTILLAADVPGQCLAICASLWRFGHFDRGTQTLVLCSQLLEYGAVDSPSSEPISGSPSDTSQSPGASGSTYLARLPTHFEWIVGFLDALRMDGASGETETQSIYRGRAISQSLNILSSLQDFSTRAGDSQLHRVLDWMFLHAQQTSTSSREFTVHRDDGTSIVAAMAACIHTLLAPSGITPLKERHALLKLGVPDFSARWCALEAHLSRTDR